MRAVAVVLLSAALLAAGVARAEDCEHDLEAEAKKMRAAKDCEAAYRTFDACLWGSTADVQRGALVREICEAGFVTRLKPDQTKAYQRKTGACEKKYAKQSGTMYRSMEAACAAKAARDFWGRYGAQK
jgi:hypothetical protein